MSEPIIAPPLWRRILPIAVLLTIYFLVSSNWLHPLLRLTSQTTNSVIILIGFCLPWIALPLMWRLPIRILARVYVTFMLLPFMLYTTVLGYAISKTLDAAEPPVVASVQMDGYRVSLYRIGSGADSGIAVQQERDLWQGLMLVKRLPGFFPAATAQYQIVSRNELLISVPAYASDHPETARTQSYTLKPHLYF